MFENLILLHSILKEGIISAIKFQYIEDLSEKQLMNTTWDDIPMFSVITGLNGVGKSTILKYIHKCSNYVNNEIFLGLPLTMADLNANKRGMTFSTSCFAMTLLVVDNTTVDVQQEPPRSEFFVDKNILDNKISINKLTNTKTLLDILKNSLDDLNAFIKKKTSNTRRL